MCHKMSCCYKKEKCYSISTPYLLIYYIMANIDTDIISKVEDQEDMLNAYGRDLERNPTFFEAKEIMRMYQINVRQVIDNLIHLGIEPVIIDSMLKESGTDKINSFLLSQEEKPVANDSMIKESGTEMLNLFIPIQEENRSTGIGHA